MIDHKVPIERLPGSERVILSPEAAKRLLVLGIAAQNAAAALSPQLLNVVVTAATQQPVETVPQPTADVPANPRPAYGNDGASLTDQFSQPAPTAYSPMPNLRPTPDVTPAPPQDTRQADAAAAVADAFAAPEWPEPPAAAVQPASLSLTDDQLQRAELARQQLSEINGQQAV